MSNPELVNNAEYHIELRTPEELLEELIHDLTKEAREVALKEFTDVTEAMRVNDKLNSSINERLGAIKGRDQIIFELSGSAVKIPEYDWKSVNDPGTEEEGIAIVLRQDGLRPLKDLETVKGSFAGTIGSIVQRDESAEKYSILVGGMFNLAIADIREVELGNTGISMMDVVARPRAYVNLVDEPRIVSVELEAARQRYELEETLAKEGLKDALFMKRLHNFGRALHSEDENAFTELQNVRVFTGIGSAGAVLARRSPEHAALISTTIAKTIGPDRRMQFGFTEMFEGVMEVESVFSGAVSLVIMPEGEEDPTKPALVVDDGESQKLIPFDTITALKF